MTIGAKRTLKDLVQALIDLLREKPLEKITIQELSDKAMISRGTFYNYFYDKYDLLNFFWERIQWEIDPGFGKNNLPIDNHEGYMDLLLRNLINYLSKEKQLYRSIMVNNENSLFSQNMHNYIEGEILSKLKEGKDSEIKYMIPIELLATIYANTITTLGKWWLKHGEDHSQEDVYKFFNMLIDQDILLEDNNK